MAALIVNVMLVLFASVHAVRPASEEVDMSMHRADFDLMDLNQDGVVSFAEYHHTMSKGAAVPNPSPCLTLTVGRGSAVGCRARWRNPFLLRPKNR